MYQGSLDAIRLVAADPSDDLLDELYGTVRASRRPCRCRSSSWPRDRGAFDEYWREALGPGRHGRRDARVLEGHGATSVSAGCIERLAGAGSRVHRDRVPAADLREQLGVSWGPGRQQGFDALCRVAVPVHRVLPRALREFPLNLVWWDTQRRYRAGSAFV